VQGPGGLVGVVPLARALTTGEDQAVDGEPPGPRQVPAFGPARQAARPA
jgi:hypothetical protein